MDTYFETYILSGGPLMIPIVICSILLVGAVIQLLFRLNRNRILPRALTDKASEIKSEAERVSYLNDIQKNNSPLARSAVRAYREIARREEVPSTAGELAPYIDESVAYVADDLYESTGILATLYTIGPLLGLLGTITGMMSAFSEFANIEQKSLSVLSAGIEEALVTTMWGLIIAIPSYIASHYFHNRIRNYERDELPHRSTEIVRVLLAPMPAVAPHLRAAAPAASAHPARPAAAQEQVRS
jgi:biopolymer transport protein ExbB